MVLSRHSGQVLNNALASLKEFGDEFASVEHLLHGHGGRQRQHVRNC
jgi:hypothetical protein